MGSELIRRGTLAALIVAACTSTALACLWDRDTLRAEAKGLPGIVDIITGRFDRFPPLYYEMRLERVAAKLETDPTNLALYDDAAVACDRLSRAEEAIEWMAKKKSQLDQLDPAAAESKDHLYRYYANLGTFHTHDWLRSGADKADTTSLQMGRDFIQAAIDLNPDAHFGRERYQLMAIEWLLDPPEFGFRDHVLPNFLHSAVEQNDDLGRRFGMRPMNLLASAGYDDAVDGLAGLITLGAAWQSVDIYYALGITLEDRGDAALSTLAKLRCFELIDQGHASLGTDESNPESLKKLIKYLGSELQTPDPVVEYFSNARSANLQWAQSKDEYVIARLKEGMHPDTHAEFWADYRELRPVPLPNGFFGLSGTRLDITIYATVVISIGVAIIVALRLLRRRRNKRAADPQLSA